jgi:hypothetical protein
MNDSFELIEKLENYSGIVCWATWETERKYLPSNAMVACSDISSVTFRSSYHYQHTHIISGASLAAANGADFIIQLRSDTIPTDIEKYIAAHDFQKVNLLGWYDHPGVGQYYINHVTSAPIEQFYKMWEYNAGDEVPYAEHIITKKINAYELAVNYLLPSLYDANDLYWKKPGVNMGNYQKSSNAFNTTGRPKQ